MSELKLYVESQVSEIGIKLFLIERGDGYLSYMTVDEDGRLVGHPVQGQQMEARPLMRLALLPDDKLVLRAIADGLNAFLGRPDDTFARGELDAAKRHLADMRALVFKTGAPK